MGPAFEVLLGSGIRLVDRAVDERGRHMRLVKRRAALPGRLEREQIEPQQTFRHEPFVARPFLRIGIGIATGGEVEFIRGRKSCRAHVGGRAFGRRRFPPTRHPRKPARIRRQLPRHREVMKASAVALRHTENDPTASQTLGEHLAQVGHAEHFAALRLPAALAGGVARQGPQIDDTLSVTRAALGAVVTDKQIHRTPVPHARKNLFAEGAQDHLALRRPVAADRAGEPRVQRAAVALLATAHIAEQRRLALDVARPEKRPHRIERIVTFQKRRDGLRLQILRIVVRAGIHPAGQHHKHILRPRRIHRPRVRHDDTDRSRRTPVVSRRRHRWPRTTRERDQHARPYRDETRETERHQAT